MSQKKRQLNILNARLRKSQVLDIVNDEDDFKQEKNKEKVLDSPEKQSDAYKEPDELKIYDIDDEDLNLEINL